MNFPITRRTFVASATATATTLFLPTHARAEYEFRFYCDDEFDDPDWKRWLKEVVSYSRRMLQPSVIANYLQLHSSGYNLAGGVWEKSNNAQEPRAYWRQKDKLLEWQLRCLQINNFQPDLTIRWAFERTEEWWGKANLDTVAIIYDPDSDDVRLQGKFEIQLNAYWATTKDSRNTKDVWGSVIAHEMLHNLGHSHGKGEYGDESPINILAGAVRYNGRYRGGYRDRWLCGGQLS